MDVAPGLPTGRPLNLPGRGRTWIYDSGPAGGEGPPVILLHGWTSTAALNWFRCFPALAVRHRVVALDHRGHGRGIRSRLPFRLEDCADDAAALVDALGLGPSVVVGYSMGGPVAQVMWRRHPQRVQALVLCATAARFGSRGQFAGPIGAVGLGASLALSLLPDVVRRQGMTLATRNWAADREVAPWALKEWSSNDPSALIQAGLALSQFDSTEWLKDIDVPTAVVLTEEDSVVPPSSQGRLAQAIPGATVFTVPGDHRACVDSSELFVPALLAAIDSVGDLEANRDPAS